MRTSSASSAGTDTGDACTFASSSLAASDSDFPAASAAAADVDPKQLLAWRHRARKLSDAGSVATVLSGPSTITTALDASTEDTNTVFESLATESLPDYVSVSRSDRGSDPARMFDETMLGFEGSEPPDSAAALAALSRASASAAAEAENGSPCQSVELAFTLENPFTGLETILEEDDSDNERPNAAKVQLGRSVSTTSFQTHQARQTGTRRPVCGFSGPVGDPASFWSLKPEPLSSELARTAPCFEVEPFSNHCSQDKSPLWPCSDE